MAAYGCTGSAVRKEFHDHVGGLRVQLGAEERDLAAYLWIGMLRDRNDCFHDFTVRYGAVWSGSVPAIAAAGGFDDRGGNGDAENGAGAEARVGADAGPEVVHLDGGVLERGRAVQCVFGAAGRGQDRSGGCVRCRVHAAAGRTIFCAVEAAGQNRSDDAGEAADGSAVEAGDGG